MKQQPHFFTALLLVAAIFTICPTIHASETAPKSNSEQNSTPNEFEQEFEEGLDKELQELSELLSKVVTGTRIKNSIMAIDRSVVKIKASQMREMHASSVPDALMETAGISIQKTNRSAGTPIIRGFVGPQNLFLIDGVRLNTSTYRTGPLQYLNVTDPFAFNHIEVLRGPGSVLYGSDAFGGVIQMFSSDLDFQKPLGSKVTLGYGTADNSIITNAEVHGKTGMVSYLAGGSVKRFGTLRTGGGKESPLSENMHLSARAKLRLQFTDKVDLTAAYFLTDIQDAGRIDVLTRGDYRLNDNQDHLMYIRSTYNGDSYLKQITLNISYHNMIEHVDRFRCYTNEDGSVQDMDACINASHEILGYEPALKSYRINDDKVHALGAFLAGNFAFLDDDLTLVFGGEFQHEWIDSSQKDASASDNFEFEDQIGSFPDGSTYLSYGVYAHLNYIPVHFAEKWHVSLNAGARAAGAFAHGHLEDFGETNTSFNNVVATGGVIISNPELISVYANFSQGFRAPNLQETLMIGSAGNYFTIPNTNLQPEDIYGFESGVKLNTEHAKLHVAYFYDLVKNIIGREEASYEGSSTYEGLPVVKKVNLDEGIYQGVEADGSLSYWYLTLFGNLTWTKGKVKINGLWEPARRVPPITYLLGLRYDNAKKTVYASVSAQGAFTKKELSPGDMSDFRFCENPNQPGTLMESCQSLSDWVIVNVRGGYLITDGLWLDVALTNISDKHYRTIGSGFDFSGFSLLGSLTYTY